MTYLQFKFFEIIRSNLKFIERIHGFGFADNMYFFVHINEHDTGPEGDKLHPLRHVVGSNRVNYKMVAFVKQRQQCAFADNINVHAQWAKHGGFFVKMRKFLGWRYFMVIPKRSKQQVHTDVNNRVAFSF